MFNSVLLVLPELVSPEARQFMSLDGDRVVGLVMSHSGQGDGSDGESRGVVESQH